MAVHRARWNRLLILKRGEKQWGPIYQGKSNKFPNRNHTECLSTPQITICTLYFYRKKSVLYFTPKVIVGWKWSTKSPNAKYTASLLFNLSFFRRVHLWKNTQIISSPTHKTQRNTTDHLLSRKHEREKGHLHLHTAIFEYVGNVISFYINSIFTEIKREIVKSSSRLIDSGI